MSHIDISNALFYSIPVKRTTIMLDDALYMRVRELSKKKGTTIREVLNDLVRFSLQCMFTKKPRQALKIPLYKNRGPLPGVDISDRNFLYDYLEGR